jgi:MFS superfamily sulfate permease-like transporter
MIDYSLAMTQLFNFKQKVDYKTEILAGLTVAMTMIPESLSFAILAKLHRWLVYMVPSLWVS